MKQAAKALFFISETIAILLSYAENKAVSFKSYKGLILDTLRRSQSIFGIKRVIRILGLSSSKLYYWFEKKKCENSIFQVCQPKHPSQLLTTEVDIVKKDLSNTKFESWSTLSTYYQVMKDKAVLMGMETWYKHARRLRVKKKFFKIKRKHKTDVRASKPLEIWHMDATLFKPFDHTKIYIYFIVYNFSRAIMG